MLQWHHFYQPLPLILLRLSLHHIQVCILPLVPKDKVELELVDMLPMTGMHSQDGSQEQLKAELMGDQENLGKKRSNYFPFFPSWMTRICQHFQHQQNLL